MSDRPPVPTSPRALFAQNFFRHPRMLGSLIPSSRFLIRRLLEGVDWRKVETVVEYGPGVGTITEAVLKRLRPDAMVIAIETNEEFVQYLRNAVPDERLRVVHGSAADVEGILKEHGRDGADVVISGIPFSTMPPEVRDDILTATHRVLRREGKFLVYQFSPSVLPHLRQRFSRIRRDFEPLNVLPAQIFACSP